MLFSFVGGRGHGEPLLPIAREARARGHDVAFAAQSGTVVGALAHGVPLVNIPMGADQMHNAERCESLGVGLTLPVMTARPDEVRSAVTTVMSERSYRENTALLRDEAVALPSALEAVRVLERLLDDRS